MALVAGGPPQALKGEQGDTDAAPHGTGSSQSPPSDARDRASSAGLPAVSSGGSSGSRPTSSQVAGAAGGGRPP
eukprot:CAMPEP_0174935650 /NCGR_PEP_ID=MMETSP1355-20121228/54493_1 /TAXON_ID=464990 /ORGANISM="Hemiselmis tepida, Strain CCMP443" /LENGTH=73 /DNA_ID=CAMNT_0016182355 /DNA_START=108 /DNA_END=326 /DNA_ORIENTATION=+